MKAFRFLQQKRRTSQIVILPQSSSCPGFPYSELLEGISTTHTLLTEQKTSCDYTLLHFSRALTERTKSGLTTHLQHLVLGFISKRPRKETVSHYYIFLDLAQPIGSRVVSLLDSGAEGPGFKSQPRRCRVTVLGKLFTPIVPLLTKQQNW